MAGTISTYVVEVDWVNDGAFTGTSDDITAHVIGLTWRRGRSYATQLTGRSIAAVCRIDAWNPTGLYNSFNANSPLTGSLLPWRQVRVQWDGTVAWSGFLNKLQPNPQIRGLNVVQFEAIGPLGYVNRQEISVPMIIAQPTTAVIGTILDKAGWPAGSRSFGIAQTTITRFFAGQQRTFNAMRLVESAEAGFLAEDKNGNIRFECRHTRFTTDASTTSQATFSDTAATSLSYNALRQEDPAKNIFNVFQATVVYYATGAATALWINSAVGTELPFIDVGESKTYWAQFPRGEVLGIDHGDISQGRAIGVDSWTDMTAGVDYVANSSSAGDGTNLTAALALTETKFATALKISIYNTGTQGAWLTTLQAVGVPLYVQDPLLVSQEDTNSQATFGTRTFRSNSRFIPSEDEADSWARQNLGIYKDPLPVVTMTVVGNRDATHMDALRKLDISDRITLVATGSSELGIDEDFYVEAERHTINRARTHVVELQLSPVRTVGGIWILGVGKTGTSTRLAY